jgi:formate hydrogenlyase subunit 3/multisubunit Na+/H+ antiporter MnhD subunit
MSKLISILDSATPFIQGFDGALMLFCGLFCLRSAKRRRNKAIALLAISCFVSTLILLGYFLSAEQGTQPLFPLATQVRHMAYLVARLLSPFELLLFAIAIILVARQNSRRTRDQ